MNKIPLNVLGISYSHMQTSAFALILGEENGNRRIPIFIGRFEAQAIAVQLEGMTTPRPLTHDLFYSFATEYGIIVDSVYIYRLEEGIFYSKLICTNGGKRVEFDARTSDAIALALRFSCPVYTSAEIMARAGIAVTDESHSSAAFPAQSHSELRKEDDLQQMEISELETMLNQAIINENYEQASQIRDEIKRRRS